VLTFLQKRVGSLASEDNISFPGFRFQGLVLLSAMDNPIKFSRLFCKNAKSNEPVVVRDFRRVETVETSLCRQLDCPITSN
jgi:hypothetical protein